MSWHAIAVKTDNSISLKSTWVNILQCNKHFLNFKFNQLKKEAESERWYFYNHG